jgi:hypothetical protein
MSDDLDEAACRRTVLSMTGAGEKRPTQCGYSALDPQRFERWAKQRAERDEAVKSKPEPAPATDWAGFDDRVANLIVESVGPAVDRLADRNNELTEEIERERDARVKLEDRVRELLLENAKALSNIARLEVAVAHLELRIANGRGGASVIDGTPSLTIN